MITLYHGSSEIVKNPEIRVPDRTLDFGDGFYLTSSFRQAENWVKRHLPDSVKYGYVNTYSFYQTKALSELKILSFDSPNEEWLDFVMSNRRIPGFVHDYDIVIGPVANDRVYTAFSLYESGIISKDILIKELKTYLLVDQYLFHTPKALEYLNFVSSKRRYND